MKTRGLAGRVVAAALLSASAWCFADGLLMRSRRPSLLACVDSVPASWALGCPAEQRFERFLRQATRELPEESRLALAGPPGPQEAFYAMWASYLLPTRSVVLASDAPPPGRVDFVLSYGRKLQMDILEPLKKVKGGWLYRVRHEEPSR